MITVSLAKLYEHQPMLANDRACACAGNNLITTFERLDTEITTDLPRHTDWRYCQEWGTAARSQAPFRLQELKIYERKKTNTANKPTSYELKDEGRRTSTREVAPTAALECGLAHAHYGQVAVTAHLLWLHESYKRSVT